MKRSTVHGPRDVGWVDGHRRAALVGETHAAFNPPRGSRTARPTLRARWLSIPLLFIALVLLGASDAFAQSAAWPGLDVIEQWRGPGFYLSLWKLLLVWLLFLLWVYTTDWVSRDVQEHRKLNYMQWNPVVVGVFVAAMVLLWILPSFWIGLPILVLAYAAPLTTYVIVRNKNVMIHERVMTRAHLRHWFASRLNKLGFKIKTEKADPHESGPPVKVFARGGPTPRDENARLGLARQTPGLRDARRLLAGGLTTRATALMFDYSQQGVAVRYLIDGVWIDRPAETREQADPALESLKVLCGLNAQERVKRQEGKFAAEYAGARLNGTLTTQGTQTGERAMIQFEEKGVKFQSLLELGMRDKMVEQLKGLLAEAKGLALFSAMPGNGLRTMMGLALRGMDRLMRDFAALEDERNRYDEVENVPVTTYAKDSEAPAAALLKLTRTEPNVIVVRDLVDKDVVSQLCEFVNDEGRMALCSMRAKDCAEATLRVLALGVPAAEWAGTLTVVVNGRLIRKLCECKEAFAPTPEMLQQLGIPAGRVTAFYRPPTPNPEEKKEVCKVCGGIGYHGRTAIFELLVVGDNVRKVLTTQPKLDLLRAAARKDGLRTLQEEGVLLVAKGITSLQELMRVMKQ